MIKHPICSKSEGKKILAGFQQQCAHSTYLNLYETKADIDKELLARLVNFIRGLYMVSAVLSNEPL